MAKKFLFPAAAAVLLVLAWLGLSPQKPSLPVSPKPAEVKKPPSQTPGTTAGQTPGKPESSLPQKSHPLSRREISARDRILCQVVDRAGRPLAGIPVRLNLTCKLPFWKRKWYSFFRARTKGPQGIALFSLLSWKKRTPKAEIGAWKAKLILGIPLARPVTKDVPLNPPPAEPVRLVLPPTGQVEVLVLDQGRPAEEPGITVSLYKTAPKNPPGSGYSILKKPLQAGKAFFPYVGLGLRLKVWASRKNSPFYLGRSWGKAPHPWAKGPGPTFPGQLVRFQVSLPKRVLIFRGKVLDPQGAPLRKAPLYVSITMKKGIDTSRTGTSLRTDGNGGMEFSFAHPLSMIEKVILEIRPPGDSPTMGAKVTLMRDFGPGIIDLGEIRLRWKPLLASGIVQDNLGRPVAGCEVEGSGIDITAWTRTNEKGEFTLRGDSKAPGLTLQAIRNGWLQAFPVRTSPGTRGNKIVLAPAGTISGSLLPAKGVTLDKILVCVAVELPRENAPLWDFLEGQSSLRAWPEKDGSYWKEICVRPKRDGSFRFSTVPPGLATLRICKDELDTPLRKCLPLLEIKGIRVLPGKETRDPRLQKIPLRLK